MRRVLIPPVIGGARPPIGAAVRSLSGETMGTTWSVSAASETALPDPTPVFDTIIAQMSHWEATSELAHFNAAPAGSWHTVSSEFFHVLSAGCTVARGTGGAFNPCAGALVTLWGFGPNGRHDQPGFAAPDQAEVESAREGAARLCELDAATSRVRQPGAVQLDLSAIAKGYAVDAVARQLEQARIEHYLVEVGGELRGAGVKPDGQPWWVELELEQSVVALHGLSVATSGDYRKFYERDGQRLSHTIDPRSGRPVAHNTAAVTVFHPLCMMADALSTAIMVMGPEEGMAFAEREGIPARMLVREGDTLHELASARFLEMLQ